MTEPEAWAAHLPPHETTEPRSGKGTALMAERDDMRANLALMEQAVSSYRSSLLEFGIDGSKGSEK